MEKFYYSDILTRWGKIQKGSRIKAWITYYYNAPEDKVRHEIATSMLRFLNLDDETWYKVTLREKGEEIIPNVELVRKLRNKDRLKYREMRRSWRALWKR